MESVKTIQPNLAPQLTLATHMSDLRPISDLKIPSSGHIAGFAVWNADCDQH